MPSVHCFTADVEAEVGDEFEDEDDTSDDRTNEGISFIIAFVLLKLNRIFVVSCYNQFVWHPFSVIYLQHLILSSVHETVFCCNKIKVS